MPREKTTSKNRNKYNQLALFSLLTFSLSLPAEELWDMDLKGAPYGYTPFCTSRESTLGYQFWREGFWKSHLRGKPYHISALYVVDLETFRRTLVGDQLRATYQQLSGMFAVEIT